MKYTAIFIYLLLSCISWAADMPKADIIYVLDSRGNVKNIIVDGRVLTPTEQSQHDTRSGGIGFVFATNELGIVVGRVYENTPAHTAGIVPGDIVLSVDGTLLRGLSLKEAVNNLRGLPGSTAELSILRSGQTNPIPVTVVREIIRAPKNGNEEVEQGVPGYRRQSAPQPEH